MVKGANQTIFVKKLLGGLNKSLLFLKQSDMAQRLNMATIYTPDSHFVLGQRKMKPGYMKVYDIAGRCMV